MPLQYLRKSDYRKLSSLLIFKEAPFARFLKLVRLSLNFTCVPYNNNFVCIAHFKDSPPSYFLVPPEDLMSTMEIHKKYIHASVVNKIGSEAMRNCIIESCKIFHEVEKSSGADSKIQCDKIHNEVNLFKCGSTHREPTPIEDVKDVQIPEYVTNIGYHSAAPAHLKFLETECGICHEVANFPESDHACSCPSHSYHYGCYRRFMDTKFTKTCPMCKQIPVFPANRALSDVAKAVLTGNNYNNIRKALLKMLRDTVNMHGDAECLTLALKQFARDLKFGLILIRPPAFFKYNEQGILIPDIENFITSYPRHSKSGPFHPTPNSPYSKNKNPTKAAAYSATLISVMNILKKIRKLFVEGDLTSENVQNHLMTLWYKISFKLEALLDDAKQRIFFLACMEKFLLDKMMFSPICHRLYNNKYILLGHAWQGHGAQKLFDEMCGSYPGEIAKYFYWAWDLRRQDQSIKPFHILINFMMCLADYDPSFREDYAILKYLMGWSADNACSSYTKWIGENCWRIVVGILFSGEYMTSMSNTFMSAISFLTYLFRVRKAMIQGNILLHLLPVLEAYIQNIIAKFYGDDGLAAIPLALKEVLCLDRKLRLKQFPAISKSIPTFAESLIQDQGCELKIDASNEYANLYTVVDDNDEIIYRGPIILKRYFRIMRLVKDQEVIDNGKVIYSRKFIIISFRETEFFKIMKPVSDVHNPISQLMRLVGHALDTHGNNTTQYNFIKNYYNYILMSVNPIDLKLNYERKYHQFISEGTCHDVETDRTFGLFVNRIKKNVHGVDINKMLQHDLDPFQMPSIQYLRKVFNTPNLTYHKSKTDDLYYPDWSVVKHY